MTHLNLIHLPELIDDHLTQNPLPGWDAQQLMAPKLINNLQQIPRKLHPEGRKASVLILLYRENGKWYFPLTQRPNYDGAHGGQISLPGGKLEIQDQNDRIQTALRETHEEIGIEADGINVIGSLTEFYVFASHTNVLPVVGWIEQSPAFKKDPKEVEQIIQTPLETLFDTKNRKETILKIKGNSIKAPYFDVEGHQVWGATAIILSEFSSICQQVINF